MTFAVLLFLVIVLGLAVLPVLPALREWLRPTDTTPLSVVQDSEVDVRHLANGFRSWVASRLARAIAACRQAGAVQDGEVDRTPYVVLPEGAALAPSAREQRERRLDRVVVACGPLVIPDGLSCSREVYGARTVDGGSGGTHRAILADGDVSLGPRAHTIRWVHAGGVARLGPHVHAHGRVSAERAIELSTGCWFERVSAPRVVLGEAAPDTLAPDRGELPLLEPRHLPRGRVVEVNAGRWLLRGDVEIPAKVRVDASLVATGRCRIRHGCVVEGSVKSRRDLVLDDDVDVRGSLVSERDIAVGRRCHIGGPVVAERTCTIGEGAVVGAPGKETTVSALDLRVAGGVTVHGALWAHRQGQVLVPHAESEPAVEVAS